MRRPAISSIVLILLLNCSASAQTNKQESLMYLKSNIEFLANDLLEGREAASRGEKLASLYIAKEFEQYGLKPFGDNGTYFENFNFELTSFDTLKTNLELICHDSSRFLNYCGDNSFSVLGFPDKKYNGVPYEVIFAGYGITADEFGYDDYSEIDVKGKIVLVYGDMPVTENQNYFNPEKHRRYTSWSYKRKNAQDHGAAGLILLPNAETLRFWNWFSNFGKTESCALPDTSESNERIPLIVLNEPGMEELMSNEEVSFSQLKEKSGTLEFPEYFTLKKKIRLNFEILTRLEPTRNVIAILEGNDEELKNEYVTIGAHYDHEGVQNGEVFNGADDNASGVVTVLEAARLLSKIQNYSRSIVFILHTGEEKGLLGAEYLTNHIPWINNVNIHINIDMVGRESVDSLYCIGSDKISSELFGLVENVNNAGGYFVFDYRFNDPNDPTRNFWRSDHIHYATKNIPVVFFHDNMETDYHKPTDDADKINFEKLYKTTLLVRDLALKISNLDHKLVVDKPLTTEN